MIPTLLNCNSLLNVTDFGGIYMLVLPILENADNLKTYFLTRSVISDRRERWGKSAKSRKEKKLTESL